MLKKMKIRTRMLVGFGTLIFLAAILIFTSLTGLKRSNKNFMSVVNEEYAAVILIKDCGIEGNNMARILRDMVITEDANEYAENKKQYMAAQERLLAKITSLGVFPVDLIGVYTDAMNAWLKEAAVVVSELDKGNKTEAIKLMGGQVTELNEVIRLARELGQGAAELTDQKVKDNISYTNIISIVCILLAIWAFSFSLFVALKITKSIVNPIYEIRDAAVEMSKGNLSSKITYQSHDAVGQLADAVRSSLLTLHTYVRDIDSTMAEMANGNFNVGASQPFIGEFKGIEDSIDAFIINISQTLTHINDASVEVSQSSNQVSNSSQILAEGATEQSLAVTELSNFIAEINEQVSQNAKDSELANEMASNAAEAINSSNEQMQKLMEAMKDINDKSDEIGKIIKAIEDIAFQTNILALNAAVEAARAGTAGKGFAVVADEVRNLAGKSAEAAKDTTTLIEASVSSVNRGVNLTNETAENLHSVVTGANSTREFIAQIAAASSKQAELLTNITKGVDQISLVVHTNSATSEESAAASEELSNQAMMLKGLVSKFKVKETGNTADHFESLPQPRSNIPMSSSASKY